MNEKLLSAFSVLSLAACSTVRVEPNDDGGIGIVDPHRTPEACEDAEPIPLAEVESGTLFGDTLHAKGFVGRTPLYLSLSLLEEDTYALATRTDPAIGAGSARWSPLGSDRYVRLDAQRLTTIARDGEAFTVVADVAFPGRPAAPFSPIMGVDGSELHVCVTPDGADAPLSGYLDLEDPARPTPLSPHDWNHCGSPELRGIGREGLYVTSGTEDPSWGTDGVRLYDVALDAVVSDHGWNVSGVHAYGNTKEVATDGELVVATLENPSYVFLYFRDADAPASIVYASLGGGEKKLLDVVDGVAYLAAPRADGTHIVAFDIAGASPTHESLIPPTPMDVRLIDAAGSFGDVSTIASDSRRLVLTDGEGRLFVISLGAIGETKPLLTFDAEDCR